MIVPVGILGEISYVLEAKFGQASMVNFLRDIRAGVFVLDCGEDDLDRIEELVIRYEALPLGFADAAVIACAERNGGRVLTLDLRDFGVVAREGKITILP